MLLEAYLARQKAFSTKTFGPYTAARRYGVIDHLRKEIEEVYTEPQDLEEWIDVIILGFDGALATAPSIDHITKMLWTKLSKNEERKWPALEDQIPGQAIEHVR